MTREEAKEAIKEAYGNSEYTDEIIKALTRESKTGHWILDESKEHGKCPNCGSGWFDLVGGLNYNFCPNCGSEMYI